MKRVYVIGYSGQLGCELLKLGAEPAIGIVSGMIGATVINAAAMTDDKKCKEQPFKAWRSNADLVADLCTQAEKFDCRLIHISTDYVFDGQLGMYDEEDRLNPNRGSVYALTKAAGEMAFHAMAPQGSSMVRTQWIFSDQKRAWFDSSNIWKQKGGLTYAKDLAKMLMKLASHDVNKCPRVLHYASWPNVWRQEIAIAFGNVSFESSNPPPGRPIDSSLVVSEFCQRIHTPMTMGEAINEYRRAFPLEREEVLGHAGESKSRDASI
jgi:dTDP-4-dehydrorhamnose reductase